MSTDPPPPVPPRQKGVTYDPDVVSRNLRETTGIPTKYIGHRKSSIPFNDRAPKVRFLRSVEPHGVNDLGSYMPVVLEPTKGLKPILKKTAFPILVDMQALEEPCFFLKDGSTNDELEGCTNYVENIIQYFSKGDREARGALDILTFPVATGSMEALSRFEGSMVIAILAIHRLKGCTGNSDKQLMVRLTKLLESFLEDIKKAQDRAQILFNKASQRYNQWARLLSRKGEFQIEHRISKVPIYTKKTMPESVTLYEDVIDEAKRYLFDGSTRIYRSTNDIMLVMDIHEDVYMKYSENIKDDQLSVIAESALDHAKDLLLYSSLNLDIAVKTLNEKLFDVGFKSVKDKIINIEFDAFFDPLCALELKAALGDIVNRKGELLNTSEHIVSHYKWIKKFIKKFLKYCKQGCSGTNSEDSKGFCGCGKPITAETLLDSLNGLGHVDFMISIPLTERFQMVIFEIQSSESHSRDEVQAKPITEPAEIVNDPAN